MCKVPNVIFFLKHPNTLSIQLLLTAMEVKYLTHLDVVKKTSMAANLSGSLFR